MATKDPNHEAGSHRSRPSITAAAILLGIFIPTYLAVWVMARVVYPPDAAAVIPPDSSMAPSAAATLSTSQADLSESPSSNSFGQVSEPADSSSRCRPSAATDSESLSD